MDSDEHEDDLLIPLSALQHYEFCPRQCMLIHSESVWTENRHTAEGRLFHERAHEGGGETRGSLRIARGLRLYSMKHGLTGIADVVEFHRIDDADSGGATLPCVAGRWRPFPVEYKSGGKKRIDADRRQLAAQALCLSEMLNVPVPAGALYYGKSRRREDVVFSETFFRETVTLAETVRRVLHSGILPPPKKGSWCETCSLREACLPDMHGRSARRYLESALKGGEEHC